MTIHWLDYAIIILYFFVVVYIGYWAMKKKSPTLTITPSPDAAFPCPSSSRPSRRPWRRRDHRAFRSCQGIVYLRRANGVVINQNLSGLYIAGRVHNIKNVYSVGDPWLYSTAAPGPRFQHRVLSSASGCAGANSGDGSHPPDGPGQTSSGGALFLPSSRWPIRGPAVCSP